MRPVEFETVRDPSFLSSLLSLSLDRPTRIRDETHLRFYASFESTSQQPFPQDILDDAATIPTLRRQRRRRRQRWSGTKITDHEIHRAENGLFGI